MRKVGGHVSIGGGISNAVINTLKIGGNCLQIFAGSPRLWSRQLWKEKEATDFTNQIIEKNLNPVFIHALYLVNLASDKPDLLQKSTDSLIIDIKNGDQINCAGVIVHIGSHQGRGFDSVKEQLVEALKTILASTGKTPLLLETDAGQNGKIGSIEELSYLIKAVDDPRLQICFDTAHLFEGGLDMRDKKVVNTFIQQLKDYKILDKRLLDCRMLWEDRRFEELSRSPAVCVEFVGTPRQLLEKHYQQVNVQHQKFYQILLQRFFF